MTITITADSCLEIACIEGRPKVRPLHIFNVKTIAHIIELCAIVMVLHLSYLFTYSFKSFILKFSSPNFSVVT